MERKPMTDVLLIPEVLPYFDQYKKVMLKDDRYFHCSAVEPHGQYLKMTVPIPIPGQDEPFEASISIPHSFVLCILTTHQELEKKILGFGKNMNETEHAS
jgi:hypothetical protein